jgi:Holliday junction resolvase RusA-like endonuclease
MTVTSQLGTIEFDVHGAPVQQGSKRWVGNRMIEMSAATLKPWRQAIASAAHVAARRDHWTLTDGPLRVDVIFRLHRPPSIPKKRRLPAVKPDLDKLIRALLDGITDSNSVWTDDARVVDIHAVKRYALPGEPLGARVRIESAEAA